MRGLYAGPLCRVFIMYTVTKEVLHMIQLEEADGEPRKQKSVASIIFWIVTLMLVLANTVSEFLRKIVGMKCLGLFILFVVGIMLLSEAGHLSHLKILDEELNQMTRGTF